MTNHVSGMHVEVGAGVARDVAVGGSLVQPPGGRREVIVTGVPRENGRDGVRRAVRQTIEAMGEFPWLEAGDNVYIKVVCNSSNHYPATTDPTGVATVVRALKNRGAGRVVVSDMAGVSTVKLERDQCRGSTRALMGANGLAAAALEAGAELYFPEEEGWNAFMEEEPLGSCWRRPIMMPNILRQMDHIVLMPRVGRHPLCGSTLGMKAAVGYWRTDTRLEYHRFASTFQEKTADANTVPSLRNKLRLVLTVADRLLTTGGPNDGYNLAPKEGLIAASESVVAHDMVTLAFLLHGRSLTPEAQLRDARRDPYASRARVSFFNRSTVYLLGGFREMLRTEPLANPAIHSIWDDRVLRRAFEHTGRPELDLTFVGEHVSGGQRKRIAELVTPMT